MKLWGNYPHLAVFPGALILDDGRSSDRNYPSSSLTQSQLSVEEPALSDGACQAGARLYLQEGNSCCVATCKSRQPQSQAAKLRAPHVHSAWLHSFVTCVTKMLGNTTPPQPVQDCQIHGTSLARVLLP